MFKWVLCLAVTSFPALAQEAAPVPLPRAHSHNDYEHDRPLLDALDHGFCGIEADIFLIDGKLLVAHDIEDVRPERTLQALYLDPLLGRARENNGQVYPGGPGITLLIDIKNTGKETVLALLDALEPYREMLTEFTRDATRPGSVTVIVSGFYPYPVLREISPRLAAVDGRLPQLGESPHEVPMVSESWTKLFQWRGSGPLPERDDKNLRRIIERAHAAGQRVRFWDLPGGPETLPLLYELGVDLLNTDDLDALQAFLLERMRSETTGKE